MGRKVGKGSTELSILTNTAVDEELVPPAAGKEQGDPPAELTHIRNKASSCQFRDESEFVRCTLDFKAKHHTKTICQTSNTHILDSG